MLARIMVVEDEPDVRLLLRMLLEDEGYSVVEAADGEQAIARFGEAHIDLILLDVRLPKANGFEVCRIVRQTSDVPIVMLTAHDDSHDVVGGLEAGADDYVTKPFVERELLARLRVQLRRSHGLLRESGVLRVGPLELRSAEALVLMDGESINLTRTEYRLLVHFMSNPNRVYSRDQLLEQVWEYDYAGDGRLVDAHVRRLRTKIEPDPASPRLLQTVRGMGYKFVA
ncbi:MAG TPA: response regulator transcription factor [Ilumatobacteraceae bacterium]